MRLDEAMKQLRSLGTAQNRKVYVRHGVRGDQFGVSFAHLRKLTRQIGKDQQLAEALWHSGNHDARILATMVADPGAMTARKLDAWVKDLDSYVVADAFSGLAQRSPTARQHAEKWIRSRKEFVATAGWNVISRLAAEGADLEDDDFTPLLATIEKTLHGSPNRTRYAMNGALIAIGSRNGTLAKKAMAVAGRIGKVHVDHGETGCKTPDAAAYIRKTRTHREQKLSSRSRG